MRRLDKSVVAKRIYEWGKGQYVLKLKGTYHNAKQKLPILHKKCGRIFYMNESDFKRGRRCSYCYGKFRLNLDYVKKGIEKLGKGHYKLMYNGKYKNDRQKLPVLHKDCGHIYPVCWAKFRSGRRCPYCYGHRRHTQVFIKNQIDKLGNHQYILLSKYINAPSNLLLYHIKCNHLFMMSWESFESGQRCPYCQHSKGEDYVENIFKKLHVPYIMGYRTKCYLSKKARHQGDSLHLDFYIPTARIGVEFDGIQHQYPVKHFGGDKAFRYSVHNDNVKNKWCYTHDISLIRIKVWHKWFGNDMKKFIKTYIKDCFIPLYKIRCK